MTNLEIASRILGDSLGSSVRLEIDVVLREGPQEPIVARCRVSGGVEVDSVIVKGPRPQSPYLPDEPGGPAGQILNEWAALEWLSEVNAPAPRLLAADRPSGVLVITDLASEGGLHDLLLGDSASAASMGMVAFAEALGVVHSATSGHGSETWSERRGRLGPAPEIVMEQWFQDEVVARFRRMCAVMEIDARGSDEEIQQVAETLMGSSARHALTHGDPCPDNILMNAGSASIIDFEGAGWRPAVLDASYFHVPFPTCWCIGAIPDSVVDEMVAAYRSRVDCSDEEWASELSAACAYWFLWTVPGSVSQALDDDPRWGTAGLRGRVSLRSKTFASVSRRLGKFERLAEIALEFERRAIERWGPDIEILPYPAFR